MLMRNKFIPGYASLTDAKTRCKRSYAHLKAQINCTVEAHGHMCGGNVSHMIWMPDCGQDNLREELDIPVSSFVFGWLGGDDSWDASGVKWYSSNT